MSELEIRNLSKSFGPVQVLKDIDLDVKDREFVVLVGPSGCGKSTLLRLMAGLETIEHGELLIDGQRMNGVHASQRGLAMVFQSYALYPHMTVAQNMSVGLRIAGTPKETIRDKVNAAAKILQLSDLLDRYPRQLSGGQRQRVAIGRAIVRNPKIFLFDEPLSNLDAALRVQMRLELAKLRRELNATVIYVTHDQVEAMTLADKIVVMNGGKIEQIGSPLDLYNKPANRFVAGFIGSPKMNFFDGEVRKVQGGQASVKLGNGPEVLQVSRSGLSAGRRVTLGVRPEHIQLAKPAKQANQITVSVSVIERLGANTFAYAQLGNGATLTVELDGTFPVAIGDKLEFVLPMEAIHVFHETGEATC